MFCGVNSWKKVRLEKPQINVLTLIAFAESLIDGCDTELNVSSFAEIFADLVSLSAQQINSVYKQTIDHSNSTIWINQRHGRVTLSIFNEIKNLVEKMQKDVSNLCAEHLIGAIMGHEQPVVTWQIKRVISTEIHAKHKYKSMARSITYDKI